MFLRTVRAMGVRDWAILVVMSLIIAFAGVFGMSFGLSESGGSPVIPNAVAFVLSLTGTVVVGLIILGVNAGLTKLSYASLNKDAASSSGADEDAPRPSKLLMFCPKLTAKGVALFAAIMIVVWLPYIIASFPGNLYNDTTTQMQQLYPDAHPLDVLSGGNLDLENIDVERAYGEKSQEKLRSQGYYPTDALIVDHHPFALTLFYGSLAQASDALFGSWMPSLAFLMIAQVLFFAVLLAFSAAYLRHRGAPAGICFAAYAFFCLLPVIPIQACTIVKDSAFTVFFIPWFLLLAEAVFTKGGIFQKKRFIVALVLLACGMCLTKKTGVYVVGATALFGAIVSLIAWRRGKGADRDGASQARKDAAASIKAQILQGGVCAVLMFALIPVVVFPALNIVPGGRQEAIGVMLQQTARVYRDLGASALTPEEREAVQGVMRVSGIEWDYNPTLTDKVKGHHYLDATPEQMLDYLKAYASVGLRYPGEYLASLLSVSSGYVAPVRAKMNSVSPFDHLLSFEEDRQVLWKIDATAPLRDAMDTFVAFFNQTPGVNILVSGVTYCLWIPALLLFFGLRNRTKAGMLFVPFAMVTLFCIIGPVYDLRYELPEIVLAPVLLGAVIIQAKSAFKARAERKAAQEETGTQAGAEGR